MKSLALWLAAHPGAALTVLLVVSLLAISGTQTARVAIAHAEIRAAQAELSGWKINAKACADSVASLKAASRRASAAAERERAAAHEKAAPIREQIAALDPVPVNSAELTCVDAVERIRDGLRE